MRHAVVIARRELASYFVSPIACSVMTVFTFVSGLFFSNMLVFYVRQAALADAQIQKSGRSDLQLDVPTMVLAQFFQNEAFLLMLAVPLLTMGLVADERRKGTIELLMTSPVRSAEISGGKFLGAFAFLALMLLPIAPMFAFMGVGGHWEAGVVASGLLGLLLLGGAQIALGLFLSRRSARTCWLPPSGHTGWSSRCSSSTRPAPRATRSGSACSARCPSTRAT